MRASVSSPHEEVSLTTDTTYYFVLESTANGLLLSSSDKLSVQLGSGSPDPDYPPTENTAPTFVLSDGSLIMEKGADALAVQSDGKIRSEEHTSELQSRPHLVCRLLLEKKNCPAPEH